MLQPDDPQKQATRLDNTAETLFFLIFMTLIPQQQL
jgi:hypothetical protein